MATIRYICTGCGRDLEVPTGMVGKKAVCPQCQAVTEVPTEVKQTKRCPFCSEVIMASAQKCRYCGEWIQVPTVSAHAASPLEQLASATQSPRPTYQYRQATAPAGWTYGASSGRTRPHMKPGVSAGLRVLSLVWGILAVIGMLIGFIPCLGAWNWVNIPFSGVGLVVGIMVLGRASIGQKGGPIAGVICCAAAVVFGLIRLVAGGGVV